MQPPHPHRRRSAEWPRRGLESVPDHEMVKRDRSEKRSGSAPVGVGGSDLSVTERPAIPQRGSLLPSHDGNRNVKNPGLSSWISKPIDVRRSRCAPMLRRSVCQRSPNVIAGRSSGGTCS